MNADIQSGAANHEYLPITGNADFAMKARLHRRVQCCARVAAGTQAARLTPRPNRTHVARPRSSPWVQKALR